MRLALDTALALGAERVSLWRRGVVPAEVWNEIKAYVGELTAPAGHLLDNCLIQNPSDPRVWLIEGARFWIPTPDDLYALGYDFSDVHAVPDGFTDLIPLIPEDGTLLQESDGGAVFLVYAGGRFGIPNPEAFDSILLDWSAIRVVPRTAGANPRAAQGLQPLPRKGRIRAVQHHQRQEAPSRCRHGPDAEGHRRGRSAIHALAGSYRCLPDVTVIHGDASCDEQ
jgi:hypothetical protein